MNRKITIFLMLGVFTPSILLAQNKNRISLQTGLFHQFFDGSLLINKFPDYKFKRNLRSLFGGMLSESRGIQCQRSIGKKATISLEYMKLDARYDYIETFNNSSVKPLISGRNIRFANINYSRKLKIADQFNIIFGGGFNYCWGQELIYHYTYFGGWGEPRFYAYKRYDFGLNGRIGLEYTPKKWLTLYSNIDYLGIVYLGAKDIDGNNAKEIYQGKFGLKNIPSRHDLSLRFGIGFNF